MNRNRAIYLCILLSSVCSTAQAQVLYRDKGKVITKAEYDADQLVNQGADFFHKGDNQAFLDATTKAMALAPHLALVQAAYGTALGTFGRYQEAREHLTKALSIDDNNPKGWCALAGLYISTGDNVNALKCYRTYLTKFPNDPNFEKIKSVVALIDQGTAEPSPKDSPDYYDSACGKTPYRWPLDKMPIAVYIFPGAKLRGYQLAFTDIVKDCFNEWSAATSGAVTFRFVDSPESSHIRVSWTDTSSKLAEPGTASQCAPYETDGVLTGADITLLTTELTPTVLSESKLKGRALQEVGHSLGLLGFSKSPGDALYFSETVVEHPSISQRDANTIRRLYGLQQEKQ
jgi:tetratricopeptide (TPR) repeat protein